MTVSELIHALKYIPNQGAEVIIVDDCGVTLLIKNIEDRRSSVIIETESD